MGKSKGCLTGIVQRQHSACRPGGRFLGIGNLRARRRIRYGQREGEGVRWPGIAQVSGNGLGDGQVGAAGPVDVSVVVLGNAVQVQGRSAQRVFGVRVRPRVAENIQSGIRSSPHHGELAALLMVRRVGSPYPDGARIPGQIAGHVQGRGRNVAVARDIDILLRRPVRVDLFTAVRGAGLGGCHRIAAEHRVAGNVHRAAFAEVYAGAKLGGSGIADRRTRSRRQASAGDDAENAAVRIGRVAALGAVQGDIAQGQVALHRDHAGAGIAAGDHSRSAADIGEPVVGIRVRRCQRRFRAALEGGRLFHHIVVDQHFHPGIGGVDGGTLIVIVPFPVVKGLGFQVVESRQQLGIHGGHIVVADLVIHQAVGGIRDLADCVKVGELDRVDVLLGIAHAAGLDQGRRRRIIRLFLGAQFFLHTVSQAQGQLDGGFLFAVLQRELGIAVHEGHVFIGPVDLFRPGAVQRLAQQRNAEAEFPVRVLGRVAQHLLGYLQGINLAPVHLAVGGCLGLKHSALHAVAVVDEVMEAIGGRACGIGAEGVAGTAVLVIERSRIVVVILSRYVYADGRAAGQSAGDDDGAGVVGGP